jgi:hypothetical protein
VTPKGLELLFAQCPQLVTLDFTGAVKNLSFNSPILNSSAKPPIDAWVEAVGLGCPNLLNLTLCNTDVTDTALVWIGLGCKKLLHLDVSMCWNLTDVGASEGGRGFHVLAHDFYYSCLHVSLCTGMALLVTGGFDHLSSLVLASTISDLGLCYLGSNFNLMHLTNLDMGRHYKGCDAMGFMGITDAGVAAIG